jgi:uncharacterized membrane protein
VSILDIARDEVLGVVNRLVDHTPHGEVSQSVTINCDVVQAEELWRDHRRLSVVLSELGEVEFTEPDRYRFNLHAGPVSVTFDSRLITENGGLRFVGIGSDDNEIIVAYRPAPQHLGTEVTLRTKTPAPDLLSGALAFKILYRARALMQTGEVPTLRENPSARKSPR